MSESMDGLQVSWDLTPPPRPLPRLPQLGEKFTCAKHTEIVHTVKKNARISRDNLETKIEFVAF